MIPILAGVIVGQHNPSKRHSDKSRSDKRRYGKSLYDKWRSGWLAMCYVLGTIVTYAIAGWMAGPCRYSAASLFSKPLGDWLYLFITSSLGRLFIWLVQS